MNNRSYSLLLPPNHLDKLASAVIKAQASDFIVEEQLPFVPDGSGEHVFLQIQKKGENTEYIARLLARIAKVRQRDIGFAGLKDRHALTTQWFSIWLPSQQEPDWTEIETENIKILHITRHARKLKRGVLIGNQFHILIREFLGDKHLCEQQLENIKTQGFPNYFGQQRFGHQGKNIDTALAIFAGTQKIKRHQRGIYLSAARAYLFNQILSERIRLNNWNQAITGDVMMLANSKSYFKTTMVDDTLQQRVENLEIHPTACLYGRGDLETQAEALKIEQQIIEKHQNLATGLLNYGVNLERRPLRTLATNLTWQFLNTTQLQLSFFLSAGSFATALLKEIILLED